MKNGFVKIIEFYHLTSLATSFGSTCWPTTTTGIERAHHICLWFCQNGSQSGASVQHNDVILTLGLQTTGHAAHTPIDHVTLGLAHDVPDKKLVNKAI